MFKEMLVASKSSKQVENIDNNLFEITSEPGDATRYSYYMFVAANRTFHFMPKDNSFVYPSIIEANQVTDVLSSDNKEADLKISKMAVSNKCNPFTVAECMRSIIEYSQKKFPDFPGDTKNY